VLERGDGDERYMSFEHVLEPAIEPWFPNLILGQEATLYREVGGKDRNWIALTSKTNYPIARQLEADGFASVVVYTLRVSGPGFDSGNFEHFDARGYTYLIPRCAADGRG